MLMNQTDEVLDKVRDHYLSIYKHTIVEYKIKFNPGGPEPLLEIKEYEQLPYPYRLRRVDLASGAVTPPNFTEVNVDTHLEYEPVQFDVEGKMDVCLEPISWNCVEFDCSNLDVNSESFSDWIIERIDPEEKNINDEYGLGGYIHSVTFPEKSGDIYTFSVDFGSANKDVFYELLTVLMELGVHKVTIHSRSHHLSTKQQH